MNRTTFLIAAVLLVLPFNMAFPKDTWPLCRVRFDNSPNGGTLANTGTADNTVVIVGYTNGTTDSGPIDLTTVSGSHDIPLHCGTIDWVYLATDGDDWLWIDQVELLAYNNISSSWVVTARKGVDNLDGWCISTDPSDGNNANCDPDGSDMDHTWDF